MLSHLPCRRLERRPFVGLYNNVLPYRNSRKSPMSIGTILLIVLILILIGALPTWPHSAGWGYYPSGGIGIVVVVISVLLLMGRI